MNLRHLIMSGELEVHEPNSSSPLVITSSRVHDVNGTLFHRSWTRDHEFTTSMERSINIAVPPAQRHSYDRHGWLLTVCF